MSTGSDDKRNKTTTTHLLWYLTTTCCRLGRACMASMTCATITGKDSSVSLSLSTAVVVVVLLEHCLRNGCLFASSSFVQFDDASRWLACDNFPFCRDSSFDRDRGLSSSFCVCVCIKLLPRRARFLSQSKQRKNNMGRIRGNKSRVSGNNGREKLQKEARHRRHKERQKAARKSLLDRIRDFLTADSFMYGPLLTQQPKFPSLSTDSPPAPLSHGGDHGHGEITGGAATAAGEATPATADEQDKDVTEAGRTSAVQSGDEETSKLYQGSRSTTTTTFLSVQQTVKIPAAEVASTPTTAELQRLKRVAQAHMRELEDEPFLLLGEHEEGTSSMTGSHDYKEDCIPLDHEIAQKVAKMLVCKVGGRYSKELGINLDVGDVEVERWFLAVTLFHRHLSFDVLKQTFKKLGDAGIASVADSLKLEESEVADILESSGYTTYKHRAAARLRKLAMQLEVDYKGKVSSMKTMLDASELSRQISSLHGLNSHTASIFLRELRGVWPGISLSYDRRTTRAAAHLGLLDPDADDASNKFTRGLQNSLNPIAHATGKDERDLEVSLVKLGLSHERHYRDCPGGVACNFLASDV